MPAERCYAKARSIHHRPEQSVTLPIYSSSLLGHETIYVHVLILIKRITKTTRTYYHAQQLSYHESGRFMARWSVRTTLAMEVSLTI